MSARRTNVDKYIEKMNDYIDKRDQIIQTAKDKCVDASTVARFKTGTDEWLEKIRKIHTKSKFSRNKEGIYELLTNLLQFATFNNGNSLSEVQEILTKPSEQRIKHVLNIHVEEIGTDLSNADKHIDEFMLAPHEKKLSR